MIPNADGIFGANAVNAYKLNRNSYSGFYKFLHAFQINSKVLSFEVLFWNFETADSKSESESCPSFQLKPCDKIGKAIKRGKGIVQQEEGFEPEPCTYINC